MRPDFLSHWPALADGDADDHQVGAFHGGGIAAHHLVGDAELLHALASLQRARRGHDRLHYALLTRRARD